MTQARKPYVGTARDTVMLTGRVIMVFLDKHMNGEVEVVSKLDEGQHIRWKRNC